MPTLCCYCLYTTLHQVGITCVRGCEVEGMLDEEGRVIEEGRIYFFKTVI